MSRFKKYEEFVNETIEPVDYVDIIIDDKFDEQISMEEYIDLTHKSTVKSFDEKEILKLNLIFKEYKPHKNIDKYYFKLYYGGFGTPKTKLLGSIGKRIDKDSNIFYILNLIMTVSVGPSKGMEDFYLKFDTLEEIGKFFKSFQN